MKKTGIEKVVLAVVVVLFVLLVLILLANAVLLMVIESFSQNRTTVNTTSSSKITEISLEQETKEYFDESSELLEVSECETEELSIIESEPITIVSIEKIKDVTVVEGQVPYIPIYASVKYSDETTQDFKIIWNPISKYDYQKVGNFTIHGFIEEINEHVECVVNVTAGRSKSFDIIRDDIFIRNQITVNNSDYVVPDNIADNIYNTINNYGIVSGFYTISLKDYTTVAYNPDLSFHTASTIKAPYALYLLKEVNNGSKSLSDMLTYKTSYWEKSSGIIKENPVGTELTVNDVLYYTLHISDNSGYYMLKDYCKYLGYNEMLQELGCKTWLNSYINWGLFTPHDLAVIWNEIYNFSFTCTEGELLLELLTEAKYNFIKSALDNYTKVAHKSGFNDNGYHDAAIIFGSSDEANPTDDYILVIMTETQTRERNKIYLAELARNIDILMRDLARAKA